MKDGNKQPFSNAEASSLVSCAYCAVDRTLKEEQLCVFSVRESYSRLMLKSWNGSSEDEYDEGWLTSYETADSINCISNHRQDTSQYFWTVLE
jgi:hypothetical protein